MQDGPQPQIKAYQWNKTEDQTKILKTPQAKEKQNRQLPLALPADNNAKQEPLDTTIRNRNTNMKKKKRKTKKKNTHTAIKHEATKTIKQEQNHRPRTVSGKACREILLIPNLPIGSNVVKIQNNGSARKESS